jgi:Tfp pilus assembly ATPase PilU
LGLIAEDLAIRGDHHFGASDAQGRAMKDKDIDSNRASFRAAPHLMATEELLATLLRVSENANDLLLSPMRPPEISVNGRFSPAPLPDIPLLVPEDTTRIAHDLIGNRPALLARLREEGSCVFSFFLVNLGRFRVHIFSQRGTYAISLRVIPDVVPDFLFLALAGPIEKDSWGRKAD